MKRWMEGETCDNLLQEHTSLSHREGGGVEQWSVDIYSIISLRQHLHVHARA